MRKPITVWRYDQISEGEVIDIYKVEVDAYVYPKKFPGLAIHRTIARGGWSITHIKSGKALLSSLPSRTVAFQLAGELTKLCDWTLSEENLASISGELKQKISAFLKEARVRYRG